ncbi:EAL and HDOD domain-containing protein [Methylohalobius crimeensis]|uniref:EAL and HDOD domain-containing protein n=1 Tax=Methylohalobius crimeensis TaxID=244365 RepID=UPI0003B48B02|nr:HDOD domain-containing protein [Methylohalobius crimeensis]
MTNFLIGRQQIFDRNLNIYGYELLFRSEDNTQASLDNGAAITQQLILDAVLEIGLKKLTGGTRAFINFTADNLLAGTAEWLPKERVVIEILEHTKITPQLVSMVDRLAAAGYLIALDDFVFDPEWEPLVRIAHFIKLDVRAGSEAENIRLMDRLKPYPAKILLEKIETEQEFERYRRLGGDYFQGYFLHRPHTIARKRLDAARQTILQLVGELHKPDIDLHRIAELIRRDSALSYKLLNFINSAWFALPRHIDSIEQAVILIGVNQIRRWTTLISLGNAVQKRPSELFRTALLRARMCELLAIDSDLQDAEQAFLVGLFSTLDALLATPLTEIVNTLPLSEEVKDGLCQQGRLGEILQCVLRYERWQLQDIHSNRFTLTAINRAYLESIAWEQEVYSHL